MVSAVHDPRYVEILSRIRAARRTTGLTQEALASSLGRPQSYVSKVESGERRIDVVELIDFCAALNMSLIDVLPKSMWEENGSGD